MKMTDYDCAAHVAGVRRLGYRVTIVEWLAAKAAVEYDTHLAWEGYAVPTKEDRALIRAASNRLNHGRRVVESLRLKDSITLP